MVVQWGHHAGVELVGRGALVMGWHAGRLYVWMVRGKRLWALRK